MEAAIEISMYPLTKEYETPILSFIDRLKSYDNVVVKTTELSTQIFGAYDLLMSCLQKEMKRSFQEGDDMVIVLKVVHTGD